MKELDKKLNNELDFTNKQEMVYPEKGESLGEHIKELLFADYIDLQQIMKALDTLKIELISINRQEYVYKQKMILKLSMYLLDEMGLYVELYGKLYDSKSFQSLEKQELRGLVKNLIDLRTKIEKYEKQIINLDLGVYVAEIGKYLNNLEFYICSLLIEGEALGEEALCHGQIEE